jgi:hypothetical protein
MTGQRYKKGEHVMPDYLQKFLPSDAVVLEGGEVPAEIEAPITPAYDRGEVDIDRAAIEAEIAAGVQAELDRMAAVKAKKVAALAKARAAKAAKKDKK